MSEEITLVNIPHNMGKVRTEIKITVQDKDAEFVRIIDDLAATGLEEDDAKTLMRHIEDNYALALTERSTGSATDTFSFSDAFRSAFNFGPATGNSVSMRSSDERGDGEIDPNPEQAVLENFAMDTLDIDISPAQRHFLEHHQEYSPHQTYLGARRSGRTEEMRERARRGRPMYTVDNRGRFVPVNEDGYPLEVVDDD